MHAHEHALEHDTQDRMEGAWWKEAIPVDGVNIDIGFDISDSFYFGPENGFTEHEWETLVEPLKQPQIERYGVYALSRDIVGREGELLAYYADVFRLAQKYGRGFEEYTWVRPLVFRKGTFGITFFWCDTFEDSIPFLESLLTKNEGHIFSDKKFEWRVDVFADAHAFYFREWNPANGEVSFLVRADRARITEEAQSARARAEKILAFLDLRLRDHFARLELCDRERSPSIIRLQARTKGGEDELQASSVEVRDEQARAPLPWWKRWFG